MRPTQRKILILLVISFFIAGLYASEDIYPEPKNCETHADCLAGKANCILKECHCKEELAIGDGKNECEAAGVTRCDDSFCKNKKFLNAYCLVNPAGNKVCKCKLYYIGGAKYGKCVSSVGRNPLSGLQTACLSRKNCDKNAKCFNGYCSCLWEYTGDGEDCYYERLKCESDDCKAKEKGCKNGFCHCKGMFIGNGHYCRKAKACPKDVKCPKHSRCMVETRELLPNFNTPQCYCDPGFGKTKAGKCESVCTGNHHCRKMYSVCDHKEKLCTCKDELILGETSCDPAPPHPCKTDKDCHAKAKCEYDECVCQGIFVGNGKFCRESTPCKGDTNVPEEQKNCGSHATCRVDPNRYKNATCKCDPGYYKNATGNCAKCADDIHCSSKKKHSVCIAGECGCKDELILGEKSCKAAPPHTCKADGDCDPRARCEQGKCVCQLNTIGNGEFCREAKKCSSENTQCKTIEHSQCVYDPFLPDVPVCKCNEGFIKSDDGTKCEDKDECFEKKCIENSKCKNNVGSYVCECNAGYKINDMNTKCEDVDECTEKQYECKDNERCKNEEGKYSCECKEGYEKNDNGKCVQKGGCSNCGRHQECRKGKCHCKKGYIKGLKGNCIHKALMRGSAHSSHAVSSHLMSALILGMLGRLAFTA